MGTCNNFDYTTATQPCTNVNVGFNFTKTIIYENDGTPIDITSFSFSMNIKDAIGGTTLLSLPIVANISTTGLYIPTPSNGEILIQIMSADTITIGGGLFPYEMTITNPSGLESIFMQGAMQFIDRGY